MLSEDLDVYGVRLYVKVWIGKGNKGYIRLGKLVLWEY